MKPRIVRRRRYTYRLGCSILILGLAVLTFWLLWRHILESTHQRSTHLLGLGNQGMAVFIYAVIFYFSGRFLKAFQIGVERKTKLVASVVLTVFLTDMVEVVISMAIVNNFRFFFDFFWRYLLLAIGQSVLFGALSIFLVNLYRKLVPPMGLLIVSGDHENDVAQKMNGIFHKYKVEESVRYDIPQREMQDKIEAHEAVLINDIPSVAEHEIIKHCFELDKRVYLIPKISDILIKGSQDLNVMDTPLYLCRNLGMSYLEQCLKRFFDIVLSGLALIVLSPVLIVTAMAIHFEDGGPVFFRQERVTRGGRRFMILKFRSMIVDAEKDGRPHPAGEQDDRITKTGHFIRACRIDELPQLINILKGDMSIVGPRPERWEHVEKYSREIPEFHFREKVKGGLTGYAQVYGKYNTTALDKLKLDLIYITNFSLILDLQIIFETVKILFQRESTEGFSEKQAKVMHDSLDAGEKTEAR